MNVTPTILLVDDSEDDRFLVRTAFQRAHFDCPLQEACNGEDAIAYLKGDGKYRDRGEFPFPALMLLDLNMPGKSGFDVLDWLRTQAGLRRLSVIVLSASERPEDVTQVYELGGQCYLVKPRTLEDLTRMIRGLRDWLHFSRFPPLTSSAECNELAPLSQRVG